MHFQPLQFLGLFVFGVVLALADAGSTGRLGPAIWAHVGFNGDHGRGALSGSPRDADPDRTERRDSAQLGVTACRPGSAACRRCGACPGDPAAQASEVPHDGMPELRNELVEIGLTVDGHRLDDAVVRQLRPPQLAP